MLLSSSRRSTYQAHHEACTKTRHTVQHISVLICIIKSISIRLFAGVGRCGMLYCQLGRIGTHRRFPASLTTMLCWEMILIKTTGKGLEPKPHERLN